VNFYLFKSFRRLLISRLVSQRKLIFPFQGEPQSIFEFIPSAEDSIIEDESRISKRERITDSLHALTKRQREAIFLKFFNELSYHEVASIMELRVDSVYNLISKAIDILRAKLKNVVLFAFAAGLL
jgi:RNA polymerase sigma factor (sigma-70 family)